MDTSSIRHWQTLTVRDVDAMTAWLTAIGFREHATYRDEADPTVVVHAEWVWDGGGIMFGSVRDDGPDGVVAGPGTSSAYLVTPDPDAMFESAVAAGATVERPMADQEHGGRGGSVRDPEGNAWSFGSYQPG